MDSPVIAFVLVVMTAVLALSAFALYNVYFSGVQGSVMSQTSVIAMSKYLQIQVSSFAFFYNTTGNYFNVSYVIWIQVPPRSVVVVPFVVHPMNLSELYYYLPSGPQNASLFYSTQRGYVPLQPFVLSGEVYLPQGAQPLGAVNAVGYNVSSNSTYVLDARLYRGEIIVIWVLYYQQGQWFRIGYTYIDPFREGMGVYVVSGTGVYSGSSRIALTKAHAPLYFTSNKGMAFGLWFKPLVNTSTPTMILNVSFLSTNNNNKNVSFLVYQYGEKLYVETVALGKHGKTAQTFLLDLTPGEWYFLNVSFGSLLGLTQQFNVTVYSESGKLLNYTVSPLPSYSELNGYYIALTFGSHVFASGISQFFFTSIQSQSGVPALYDVSSIMFRNGPYYNDTVAYKQVIENNYNRLYAIGYWYFVWPTSNPPSQIYGIFWYYPQGSSNLKVYYFPEVGYNTYIIT